MKARVSFSFVLIGTFLLAPAYAKGPKDATPSKKYQSGGGYSGGAVSSKSKYGKLPDSPSVSRIPTQAPITKKYKSSAYVLPSRTSTSAASVSKNFDRYSKKRPTFSGSKSAVQTPGPSDGRPPSTVRFPTRPIATPPRTSPISPGKQKTQPIPAQRPPIVFYPKPGKYYGKPSTTAPSSTQPSAPSRPTVQRHTTNPGTRQPSPTVFKSKYFQPTLRPEGPTNIVQSQNRGPVIINRPTTINQSTTNITRETNNINNWYANNHWQNRVTISSRNWNDRPWWYQPDYGSWHHGHWHGDYIRGGPHRDDWRHVDTSGHQWLAGLASWGLGNLIYRTGYQFYVNPYCVRPIVLGTTTIDYSRPIAFQRSVYERAFASDEAKAAQLRTQALQYFEIARRAFYLGDLNAACDSVNRGIALMPDDTTMHEFRGLVLFAAGKYGEAAEVVHAVLAVAPGWDWTTLNALYQDTNTYARQLRNLEDYVEQNSRDGGARFLLAYHYITLGHPDSAAEQLSSVRSLAPSDRLANDLLDMLAGERADEDRVDGGRPPTKEQLEGDWEARRPEGKIELEIDGDEFAWDYDLDENDDEFKGKFVLAQDVMVLAAANGSQMVGRVSMNNRDKFTFRLIGADDDDPGIVFERD